VKLHELQILVSDFVARAHIDTGEPYRMLDLVSEMGEVSKEILKATDYGKKPFKPTPAWSEELGDVMFCLLCLANKTGVDLEAALINVLKKYRRRLDASGDAGSGN